MRSGLKWLSTLTSAGMFFVLLAGALVTKTGSGRGCGTDWPLCNGKFVPAYTIESMIEYSHRAVSGIVGLLVLLTAIWVWKAAGHRKEALLYASSALFFTVLQAMLGAMAVIWKQSSAVLALHFGISLLAFSSTLLLAILMWRNGNADAKGRISPPLTSVSKPFAMLVWTTTLYSYVVIYIGAFVRHTKSHGGCTGWPLCNGEVVPTLSGAIGIAFGHRVAALLLSILIVWMGYVSQRDYTTKDIKKAGLAAIYLTVPQVASGAFVVFMLGSEMYVFASLLHTVIITGLFGILCYLSIQVWKLRRVANRSNE